MSSTLILIGLLLSLSMAVILPEIQISKNQNSYAYIISPEYDSMVNRQRRGYLVLGLLAVSTFLYLYRPCLSHYLFFILFLIAYLVFMRSSHFRSEDPCRYKII